MMKTDVRPAWVSSAIAGRLLGFVPPQLVNRDRADHPELYPQSPSPRRFAMVDIDNHPRRDGRPVDVAELLGADKSAEPDRLRYQHYNATRKQAAHVGA